MGLESTRKELLQCHAEVFGYGARRVRYSTSTKHVPRGLIRQSMQFLESPQRSVPLTNSCLYVLLVDRIL